MPIIDLTNRPITNPTIEAVDDLKVQVHTYDAEMGTPSRNQLDLAFSKEFKTGGTTSTQLRMEVINVTNNPWFTSFTSDVGSASFGQITTQGNYPRVAQITLRTRW